MTNTTKYPIQIAAVQFSASNNPQHNIDYVTKAIHRAADRGASLVVLPECALYARAPGEQYYAEPLDGPFVTTLCALSDRLGVDIVAGMTETSAETRVYNTAVIIQDGKLSNHYRKLHLYDAFSFKESEHFIAGTQCPPTFIHRGLSFGVMICYDLRFPEPARLLAAQGVDVILLPTSWFAGPLKEWHWQVLCAARALENGVYLLGVDACSGNRIGLSRLVDPYGVTVAQLGTQSGELLGTIAPAVLEQARREMPLLTQRRFHIDPQVLPINDSE